MCATRRWSRALRTPFLGDQGVKDDSQENGPEDRNWPMWTAASLADRRDDASWKGGQALLLAGQELIWNMYIR